MLFSESRARNILINLAYSGHGFQPGRGYA
jgi:hypothetical protein